MNHAREKDPTPHFIEMIPANLVLVNGFRFFCFFYVLVGGSLLLEVAFLFVDLYNLTCFK